MAATVARTECYGTHEHSGLCAVTILNQVWENSSMKNFSETNVCALQEGRPGLSEERMGMRTDTMYAYGELKSHMLQLNIFRIFRN